MASAVYNYTPGGATLTTTTPDMPVPRGDDDFASFAKEMAKRRLAWEEEDRKRQIEAEARAWQWQAEDRAARDRERASAEWSSSQYRPALPRMPAGATPWGGGGGLGASVVQQPVSASNVNSEPDPQDALERVRELSYRNRLREMDLNPPKKLVGTGFNQTAGYVTDYDAMPLSMRPREALMGGAGPSPARLTPGGQYPYGMTLPGQYGSGAGQDARGDWYDIPEHQRRAYLGVNTGAPGGFAGAQRRAGY